MKWDPGLYDGSYIDPTFGVGTLEWFEAMDADAVYEQHETPADCRDDMTDPIDETDADDELELESDDGAEDVSLDDVATFERPEPALKYYKRKAERVETAQVSTPKPKWDDSVGIPDEFPRGSKGWELAQARKAS